MLGHNNEDLYCSSSEVCFSSEDDTVLSELIASSNEEGPIIQCVDVNAQEGSHDCSDSDMPALVSSSEDEGARKKSVGFADDLVRDLSWDSDSDGDDDEVSGFSRTVVPTWSHAFRAKSRASNKKVVASMIRSPSTGPSVFVKFKW